MNSNQLSNLISQGKYLKDNDLTDSDKYFEIYKRLQNLQNGMVVDQEIKQEELDEILTDKQIFQIRQQILAYKYLVRNMPLPKDIEKNMFNISKDQWDVEVERIMTRSIKYYNEKIEKNEELKRLINDKINKRNQEGQMMHEQAQTYFTDKRTYFIDKRKNEIQNLINTDVIASDAKTKLLCELKILNLIEFYDKIRERLVKNLTKQQDPNQIFEMHLLDRQYYKREKQQKKFEGKSVEKVEVQLKIEQEKRKKLKHKEFLQSLFNHQNDFFEFHKKLHKATKKRATNAKNYLEQIVKKQEDQKNEATRARIKLLKEQNFSVYLDTVQKLKDSRIVELLKQTDDFLRQLGAKVLLQKGEKQNENQDEDLNFGIKSQDFVVDIMRSNRVYYNLTHTKKEQLEKQPLLLDGGILKSYQLIGLQWLVSLYNNKLNGILADEMGLGKTIQTIALFAFLMETKKVFGPFLIVVPLSTLSNWCMEFEKWAPSIKFIAYKGSPQTRKDISKLMKTSKWNVCITTYDYILKDRLTLHKWDWKYIVVDEGHRMKNARSKFAQVLGQQYTSEYRILLTGTPLQNNLAELWSLLNFLLPKVFQSCDDFEKWFSMPFGKVNNEKDKDQMLTEEEQLLIINRLHQVLRPFLLRRVKREVEAELPNKVEHVIKVELSHWQKLVQTRINERNQLTYDPATGRVGTKALMNLMMQLRKICNHPYLFMPYEAQQSTSDEIWRCSGKFELLDRILPKLIGSKHRVLIFTQMTQLMDIMEDYFRYKGIRYLRLDGATKADERGEKMIQFNKQDSEFDVFMLSTRAGGLGLNLQSADTVILFDSDWNPQMDLQAQDRAHRIGQKNEVRVFRLVTNTWIEEEILSKAAYKVGLDEMIIQAGLYDNKSTDNDRKEKIEDILKKNKAYDDTDDEVPNDQQINEMLQRNEEEYQRFQEMDQERYQREKKIYKNFVEPTDDDEQKFINYRLITMDEVPQWIKNPPKDKEEKKEYGRGNRKRNNVNYSDELSDIQFYKMIEEEYNNSNQDHKETRGRPKKGKADQFLDNNENSLSVIEEEYISKENEMQMEIREDKGEEDEEDGEGGNGGDDVEDEIIENLKFNQKQQPTPNETQLKKKSNGLNLRSSINNNNNNNGNKPNGKQLRNREIKQDIEEIEINHRRLKKNKLSPKNNKKNNEDEEVVYEEEEDEELDD